MKKTDEDLRKDIENLEKLIEEVKTQNKEELDKLKQERKPAAGRTIKIDLSAEYSQALPTNFIVGFLVNFILFFLLIGVVGIAEAKNDFIYAGLALAYTVYETILKRYLFRKQLKLVLYSSGLVFFLTDLVFFYAADLLVLPEAFSFIDYWIPLAFVAAFSVLRFFVRSIYVAAVKGLSAKTASK